MTVSSGNRGVSVSDDRDAAPAARRAGLGLEGDERGVKEVSSSVCPMMLAVSNTKMTDQMGSLRDKRRVCDEICREKNCQQAKHSF